LKAMIWYQQHKPFDLVIDQHHGIPWYAPWWCKTNSVAYIHEVLGPIWNAFYSWPISAMGQFQERRTHRLYRNVPFWTPSESTKRALLANGVRNITVLPNGTDTTPLAKLDDKTISLPLRLVVVCRLAANKRVDHAILVVKLLLAKGIKTQLTIVGGGEVERSLKQLVEKLGLTKEIIFAGPLAEFEKNEALRNAHFLVHTSIREGWGLNVIEANAMGVPAVVYPVDGLVDSTIQDVTGIITPEESPESMAACLEDVLKTPAKYDAYRLRAWERSKAFAWDKVLPPACEWLEMQARSGAKSQP
jgi:glycosyltransferase involved in cell wall biosynthesis